MHQAIREADLFSKYRKRQSEDIEAAIGSHADDANASDGEKAARREAEAKRRQRRQNDNKKDIAKTSKLFYEIKDTSDELRILQKLASHQKEVQANLCGEAARDDSRARNIVDDIEEKISLANKIRQAVSASRYKGPGISRMAYC